MMLRPFRAPATGQPPLGTAAPVPKESKRTDEHKLLGTWEVVRYSCYGQDQVPTKPVQWQLDADGKGP